MPTTLVIVESPIKCKKIEEFLGPGYKVMASFGHIRSIEGLGAININNNFETTYSLTQDKIKLRQIEKLRSEISKADDVIIATDDDREGEAIGWHICVLFNLPIERTKRIIFHEITAPAIQSAIAYPTRINMNTVHSQQARQILDLLVGFTISPILWKCISKTHDNSLSAGRCQTPALRIIYDNYTEINNSLGKFCYVVTGYFTSLTLPFELSKRIDSEDKVRQFLLDCENYEHIYTVTNPKRRVQMAPEPLTTSRLQQLASSELRMSPKETMKCAQQLYENGFITYMRTDSKKYSQSFIDAVSSYIIQTYGDKYVSSNIRVVDNAGNEHKTSEFAVNNNIPPPQEAHEAIRPVNINVGQIQSTELTKNACKIYELIWKTSVKSCMSSSQYNYIMASISAPMDMKFVYKAEEMVFSGWQAVDSKQNTNESVAAFRLLTNLKQDTSIKCKKILATFTVQELKSHYTEANLVKILEDKGIGRPSTFAMLVDKIQERKYVEVQNVEGKEVEGIDFRFEDNVINEETNKKVFGNEQNKLVIQQLGIIVIEFLLKHFPSFFDYDYTKEMEQSLDKIAKNEMIWHSLCEKCFNELNDEAKEFSKFSLKIDDNHELIVGKHGPVIKATVEGNVSFIPVKKELKIDEIKEGEVKLEDVVENKQAESSSSSSVRIGKYKGQDLFVKNGKYGIYAQWGSERKSLKEMDVPYSNIKYIDVLRFLEKEDSLDPSVPVGIVREVNKNISIRTGKYGDYIFYKKPRAKKPEFFKLNGFGSDYKKCDKELLLNWIKHTYNIE